MINENQRFKKNAKIKLLSISQLERSTFMIYSTIFLPLPASFSCPYGYLDI